MTSVQVVAGFSLLNRWLLYANVMLAPAQFIAGPGSFCPSALGFLAFNAWTQFSWSIAIRNYELNALSLILPHFNLIFLLSYPCAVSSGTKLVGVPLGFATVGLMAFNTLISFKNWVALIPEGLGVYQFFFFGWQTLTPQWYKFIGVWQIFDMILALVAMVFTIGLATTISERQDSWWAPHVIILPGAALMLLIQFPCILWTELIVSRNHIESETDWVSVWLFIAQVAALLFSPLGEHVLRSGKDSEKEEIV